MKPIYLEFCGVNSFSEKATIDFKKLFSNGIFGIFGDTGSGKSTILDCIQLALYGTIDRSGETECINRKSDGFYIVYDFELEDNGVRHTYRVRRERTRKSGNNTKAFLYELTEDGKQQALAEGTRDVNRMLLGIIGLELADFKICIALPQGEFAGLVKAKPAERLALVSRLFDLSKYGEKLKIYLRTKCEEATRELEIAQAKLSALDDCSEERKLETENKIRELKESVTLLNEQLTKKQEELTKAETLLSEKHEYEKAVVELEKAEKLLPSYERKRSILQRYTLLKGLSDKNRETITKNNELAKIQSEKQNASSKAERLTKELALAQQALSENDYETKIEEVSRILGRFENAKEEIAKCEELTKALLEIRLEYNALKNKVAFEPFDELLQKNALALEKLGEEDSVAEYVKKYLKDDILAEGYGQVCDDLKGLAEKYPQTQADIEVLLQKYSLSAISGESFDLNRAQAEFKAIEAERKRLKAEANELEKRKKAYEENEIAKSRVQEKGTHIREMYDFAKEKMTQLEKDGTLEEVTARFNALKKAKKEAEDRADKAKEELSACEMTIEKYATLESKLVSERMTLLNELENGLKENCFESILAVNELLVEIGDESLERKKCDDFFVGYASRKAQLQGVDLTKFNEVSEQGVYALKAEKRSLDEEKNELMLKIGGAEQELKKIAETKLKYDEYEKEYLDKKKTSELWEKLRATVSGRRSDKTLMDFVATEYLQDVCLSAGKTLLSLTNSRYFLRYQGGEFFVGDNLDGGQLRAVRTLSGGETFLVSLSLALSLSASICQKSLRPIEFFFLDEGFGTLDGKLVETVMDVLGKLSKSFTIGLISHVEEMKHRIGNKLVVTGANEEHGSQIRMETF